MAFSKSLGNTTRNMSGTARTVIAAPAAVNYPPIASTVASNQLTPGGSIASSPVKDAPSNASLNDTATAFNKPIPPGGAPTRNALLRR